MARRGSVGSLIPLLAAMVISLLLAAEWSWIMRWPNCCTRRPSRFETANWPSCTSVMPPWAASIIKRRSCALSLWLAAWLAEAAASAPSATVAKMIPCLIVSLIIVTPPKMSFPERRVLCGGPRESPACHVIEKAARAVRRVKPPNGPFMLNVVVERTRRGALGPDRRFLVFRRDRIVQVRDLGGGAGGRRAAGGSRHRGIVPRCGRTCGRVRIGAHRAGARVVACGGTSGRARADPGGRGSVRAGVAGIDRRALPTRVALGGLLSRCALAHGLVLALSGLALRRRAILMEEVIGGHRVERAGRRLRHHPGKVVQVVLERILE